MILRNNRYKQKPIYSAFLCFVFFSDYWEKVAGYMAFYAVILFTFFALLLPWAVLMLGGNNPFLWLWNYLDNVHIRVRKYAKPRIATILLVLEIRSYDLWSTGRRFPYMKRSGMPVISLRDINQRFWSHLWS